MTMDHRPRALVAALASALLLGGCAAQLPTTAEPQVGLPVDVQPQPEIERLLNPPQPDATAADIVRGFLRANVGFADEEDIPRRFLVEDLASEWVPTSNVLVYTGTPAVTVAENGREAEVGVEVIARIDAQGRLTEQSPGTVTQTFQLARVGGQWRISGFPEGFGVWLTRQDLEASFSPTDLFYLSPHGQHFVPEVRWLARGEGQPTAVTRAQLAPVPEHLAGAVRTGGGEGVRLAGSSVSVDPETRVATVPLEGPGLSGGGEAAAGLVSQLGRALLELGAVSAVDVQVSGQSLTVGGAEGPVSSADELPFTDAVRDADIGLLRIGEQFFPVNPADAYLRNLPEETVDTLDLPRLGLAWGGVAATEDLDDFAAVSTDRTSLWRWQAGADGGEGESTTNAGIADELTPPAVDPQGAFLVAGVHRSTGAPRVWWLDRDDVFSLAEPIEVPWLRQRDRVRSLSVSPDGTRVAMLVGDATRDRQRLVIAGLLRNQDGEPTGLTRGIPAAGSLVDVVSARWASPRELYLVGQRAEDAAPRGFLLPQGEFVQPMGAADGIDFVEIVPVPRIEDPRPVVRGADGRFYSAEGNQGWSHARNGDELVIPGG